jgi:hypothetical protein
MPGSSSAPKVVARIESANPAVKAIAILKILASLLAIMRLAGVEILHFESSAYLGIPTSERQPWLGFPARFALCKRFVGENSDAKVTGVFHPGISP